jgi:hypothetical protein
MIANEPELCSGAIHRALFGPGYASRKGAKTPSSEERMTALKHVFFSSLCALAPLREISESEPEGRDESRPYTFPNVAFFAVNTPAPKG